MKMSSLSCSWLALGALTFVACDVAYEIGPKLDAAPPFSTSEAGVQAPAPDAGPNMPAVAIRGIPFACERWGQGRPLKNPQASLAQTVQALWQGDAADLDEARASYGDVLSSGRSGDLHCVALHMLDNVRAVRGVGAFYDQWLSLGQYPPKDPELFPDHPPSRLELMARDARDFAVDTTLRGDDNWTRLFTTRRSLTLAPDWQGPAPELAALSAGLLTEPGVLASHGSSAHLSATARGAWFMSTFFCSPVPPPPPSAEISLGDIPPNMSYRQRLEFVTKEPTCKGCHNLADPAGFALDPFDAVGRLHSHDRQGKPFDTRGTLDGDSGQRFANIADIGVHTARSEAAQACYVREWLSYISGQEGDDIVDMPQAVARGLALNGRIKPVIAAAVETIAWR